MEFVDRGTDRLAIEINDPDPDRPFVVLWPAMGVRARYYRRFADDLVDAGLAVAVCDLRGHGASTPPVSRRARYGYAELAGDVGAVLDALKDRLNGRPVVLLGHSLGGQVALINQATGGPPVAGIVLVACGIPYWRRYEGVWRLGLAGYSRFMAATIRMLGWWPGDRLGFPGGRQAGRLMRDWAYTARTGRYPAMDGVDVEQALHGLASPVLWVQVEHDRLTPPATVEHLCAKLPAAQVEHASYTDEQAGRRLDHLSWPKAGGALARRVREFVDGL